MKKSYVILDRDGVINYDSAHYIKSPEEWQPIPGSLEAIAKLNRGGFCVLIATNQSGVARGFYDHDVLKKIHEKLTAELESLGGSIEEIFYCPHHPEDNCNCRKPKPGMLQKIQAKYQLDFKDVFYIGDSIVDMQVAITMNCKPILVLTGNGKKTLENHPDLIPSIHYFADLSEAVDAILSKKI